MAAEYEVVVPSIPGFPGAVGHTSFDSHIDWVLAIRDLLKQSGLLDGAPLIGSGPGGSLAADVAAFWPDDIDRLALIAPWGLSDGDAPMACRGSSRPAR